MKKLILILLLTSVCFAQNKLLKELNDFKTNPDVKNFLNQISAGKPILNNLAESGLKEKPFSLANTIKLSEFSFEEKSKPSKKFNFSKYDLNKIVMTNMTESMLSRFGKGDLILPEVKKMSTNKDLHKEIIETLFENK